jgi:hypothetical protein
VLAHGRALLANYSSTTVINADLREPDTIFGHPETQRLINGTEPFAVLLGGILMHLEDEEDPEGVAASIRNRLPSGGFLLASNTCDTGEPRARELARVFAENGMGTRCFRIWDEQIRYFDGLDLVEPGLVPNNKWRPGSDVPAPENPAHAMHIGGSAGSRRAVQRSASHSERAVAISSMQAAAAATSPDSGRSSAAGSSNWHARSYTARTGLARFGAVPRNRCARTAATSSQASTSR